MDYLPTIISSTIRWASILLLVYGVNARAATTDMSLDVAIDDFAAPIGNEFGHLCGKYHGPCGLEEKRCNDLQAPLRATTKIHLKKTTVRGVLDNIVKIHGGYRWIARDGVLNFEPINRIGPDLLARKLDNVSIHGITSSAAAYRVLRQAGLQMPLVSGSGVPRTFPSIDIEMKDVTLRDALNAIAKADGHLFWRFAPDKPEQSTVCFVLSR